MNFNFKSDGNDNVCFIVLCTEQEITLENIVHLEESDLKELGFLMGPRKVVMGWIKSRQMLQSAELPSSSPSPSSSSSSSTALHAVSPTTPQNAVLPDNRASIFKVGSASVIVYCCAY